jgi:CMP-N-acetylneuraminate monooxygenase
MFKDLGRLKYISKKTTISIPLQEIPQDVSIHSSLIIFREDGMFHVYDRKCDHNGGTLCLMNNSIKCPMHDWEFDARIGQYSNVQVTKKELNYEISNENLIVEVSEDTPILKNVNKRLEVRITFLSHACLLVETDEFSFITDPWIVGFAFAGGWWPNISPPEDWASVVNKADFIYISHNHPDHLNLFTLKHIRKDMEFIVPDFQSNSVSKILVDSGFVNIFPAHFQDYYQYKDTNLFLTIFKSGDFRDDSGLYFTYGDFSFLSTVDSNDLNFKKFPQDVTLFASAFASGASGYPLCFDNLDESNKDTILDRNRRADKAIVKSNIKKCNPKYFLPYAGFFKEKAKRDSEILSRNVKNNIEDFRDIKAVLLNIENFDSYVFHGQEIIKQTLIPRNKALLDSPEEFIRQTFSRYLYDEKFIKQYFEKCNFRKDLVLYVALTNDDFSQIRNFITVDFRDVETQIKFDCFHWKEIKKDLKKIEEHKFNSLHIKIRQDAFLWVIYNQMPWEDLSIGFQCRIDRVPNVYNVDFWHHFTNIYL